MPIAGVVILTEKEQVNQVLDALQEMEKVSTYGIHKENNIVAVFEGDTADELERISKTISDNISGVIGVYPSYVNYEDMND